jgi:hypothetical protein
MIIEALAGFRENRITARQFYSKQNAENRRKTVIPVGSGGLIFYIY